MTSELDYYPRLADMKPLSKLTSLVNERENEATKGSAPSTAAVAFEGRTGYSESFLDGFEIVWPNLTSAVKSDLLSIGDSNRLDYMHFSVAMSKSRRMALYVGVNIDGQQAVQIKRSKDVWRYDGRIPREAQIGNELYLDNLLDRGHLVRREDPNWGGDDAVTANEDTFHFTNSAPQMAGFNQRTWLSLERYILDNARSWQERITVFSGPVFGEDDRDYRGVKIPEAFWKVVAFLSGDKKPSATAYIIEQAKELSELEAAFGAFRTYQCSVSSIEQKTGIDFGELRRFDGFSNEELVSKASIRNPIVDAEDILV